MPAPLRRRSPWTFAWPVLLVAWLLLLHFAGGSGGGPRSVSYDAFEQALAQGRIARVQVTDTTLVGRLKTPDGGTTELVTARVDPELAARLDRYRVPYERVVQSGLLRDLLAWTLPTLLFFGLWFALSRATAGRGGVGGFMGLGRSGAKVHVENDTGVTFADVAGVDEAKAELEEVVEFLRRPKDFERLGARIPRGVLLVGPPGTGKTMLAKAVAGQARVPFFSISGSEFVEMFVGVGAARVRDLFRQARERAPAIVFIDELDALGRARGLADGLGGGDEKEQTLNQLLAEMDGFDTSAGVVMLAATNRPEILDPALLRAGRFDRQVLVDRPDKKGRIDILKVHMRKVKLAPDVDPEAVAALTPGFTGADLANLVNEAALLATRRRGEAAGMADFNNAVERMIAGLEKRNRLLNPKEREIVAFHEMGHTLVALSLPGVDPVHKVSIIPRGVGALGYTIQRPIEDRFLMTKEELENKMAVLLGGRAAELIVFDHLSTGAADDLRRVTDIARSMVTRYGMSEKLGSVAYDREPGNFLAGADRPYPVRERDYAEETAAAIDYEVRAIVDRVFQRTQVILKARRAVLDRAAKKLLEKETLERSDLETLIRGMPQEGLRAV